MDKNVQYILEVAKCGGITKAANNLYITPSALSKFVQAREEELNVQLFHRIGKRFVLTAAGEYYVGRCKEIETIQRDHNSDGAVFQYEPRHDTYRCAAFFFGSCFKRYHSKVSGEFSGSKNYFTGVFNRRADGAVEKTAGGCGAGNN